MSRFVAPVQRKQAGRNHYYVDGNDTKMPGVTTILGDGVPKKALVEWAGNATADYALDHWDELSEMAVATRLKTLRRCRYIDRDAAARRGTEVHTLAEQLVSGDPITVPDELRGHCESYVRFLDDFEVDPVLVEAVVASYRYGYAGTLDLIADLTIGGHVVRWLLDIKTNRSGVYGETALQLAAYRYADVYGCGAAETPMPEVTATGVVHVRADGYDLVPVTAGPDQHLTFRYVQQIAAFTKQSTELLGEPIPPPDTAATTPRPHRVDDRTAT